METTVLEYFPAIAAGHLPENYITVKDKMPIGAFSAKLDFMLWSKSRLTINCFFTLTGLDKNISLPVYRKAATGGKYLAGKTEVQYVSFGDHVRITIELDGNGKPVLTDLTSISNSTK